MTPHTQTTPASRNQTRAIEGARKDLGLSLDWVLNLCRARGFSYRDLTRQEAESLLRTLRAMQEERRDLGRRHG
jgi:hypothetical protein